MNTLNLSESATLTSNRSFLLHFKSNLRWLLVAGIVLILTAHFLLLTVYPPVFIDEGWLANTSWSWLTTGINFDTIHAGVLDQFGYEWVTDNFLGQVPYVLSYNVLGLGLFQTRLVSWVFSVVLVIATIQVGRRCYSLETGLLAALLLSLTVPFLQSSRWRQDIILAAMIMVSFGLALYALDKDRLWAHFLAGLVLGLGFDVHQTSIIFIPALAALYFAHYGKRFFFVRGTWLVGLGGALGLAFYAINHMLQNYEVYSRLMSFYFVSGGEAQIPIANPSKLLESAVREFGRYRFRDNPFDLVLIAIGGLFLLYRRSKSDRLILTYTGVTFISFILLSGDKTFLYAINLYPFFMLIVAETFLSLARQKQGKIIARVAPIVLVIFIGYSLYQSVSRIYVNRNYDYYAITNQIRQVVPVDRRIMGMPTWWIGLADYDYRSSLSIPYYKFFNNYDVRQAVEAIHPDYIIVDGTQQVILVDEGQRLVPGMNVFSVPRQEFNEILESLGELVLEFSDQWHGDFKIYRINWDQ